jgi:aryl-alcohol dehydrogenase-like predicted oxidoreductase
LYTSAIDSDRRIVGELAAVAAGGVPKAQVALAWVAQHAVVTAPSSAPRNRIISMMPSQRCRSI